MSLENTFSEKVLVQSMLPLSIKEDVKKDIINTPKFQCPYCKKFFIRINAHKCRKKQWILSHSDQKDLFGNPIISHFQKFLNIEKTCTRKKAEKEENSVYTYWEIDGKKLRAFNMDKHECFLKSEIFEFIGMKEKTFETLWKRIIKGQFDSIEHEFFKEGLHYLKLRKSSCLKKFNKKGKKIIDPRNHGKYVYFITPVGLKTILLHTNQEYPIYIAHRLFELEYAIERNDLYGKQLFPISHENVKKLIGITYQNTLKILPIDEDELFIDINGNKFESKGEVNISNALILIGWLTGMKLEAYHPDIVKFSEEERERYKQLFNKDLLIAAGWINDHFPYGFHPDWGVKNFPKIKIEYFGGTTRQYYARRKIKEFIYKERGYSLISIEKDEDANYPLLIEKLIEGFQLRKSKNWKEKL